MIVIIKYLVVSCIVVFFTHTILDSKNMRTNKSVNESVMAKAQSYIKKQRYHLASNIYKEQLLSDKNFYLSLKKLKFIYVNKLKKPDQLAQLLREKVKDHKFSKIHLLKMSEYIAISNDYLKYAKKDGQALGPIPLFHRGKNHFENGIKTSASSQNGFVANKQLQKAQSYLVQFSMLYYFHPLTTQVFQMLAKINRNLSSRNYYSELHYLKKVMLQAKDQTTIFETKKRLNELVFLFSQKLKVSSQSIFDFIETN